MEPKPLEAAVARMLSRRSALAGGVAGLGALTLAGATTVLAQSATPASGEGLEGNYVVVRTRVMAQGKSVEELTTAIRTGLVPIIKQIPGFVEYYIVQNAETRQRSSVSIFKDKAGADESTSKAGDFLKTNNLTGYYEDVNPVVVDGSVLLFAD
jgi:hypothetical protein